MKLIFILYENNSQKYSKIPTKHIEIRLTKCLRMITTITPYDYIYRQNCTIQLRGRKVENKEKNVFLPEIFINQDILLDIQTP